MGFGLTRGFDSVYVRSFVVCFSRGFDHIEFRLIVLGFDLFVLSWVSTYLLFLGFDLLLLGIDLLLLGFDLLRLCCLVVVVSVC